ncbi:MAG: thiamine pyrophosphate-binding protein, partial [Candidatus Hydrothermarchaeota archaeon]|nr:thiamine pyrophosphate-binding protein [Candidatus Hydrothermarchaeota archaeon]
MRFRCTVCNWVYDEGKEGKNFADLPASYACPVCGALKNVFVPEEKVETEVSTTVADKIVEQLAAVGVERIYGIPGESNLPLVEAIRKNEKVEFILTRHEATAAFMASAHGKLTGELGVCLSIAGPGTTNLITGLIDAATDGAPVLALTGQVPQLYLGSEYLQEIDQIELFRPFTVFSETIAKASQAIMLTSMAVKKAYSKMGVAHLSLPTDVLAEGLEEGIWKPGEHVFKPESVPRDEDLRKAAKLIDASSRPVILGGWGIRNAGKEVLRFAEKISAPIVTTSRAKGAVPETRENVLGVIGAIGMPNAARALVDSDLLIVLGSGFRQRNLLPEIPVIQVDVDGVKLGRSFPVKVGLVGDARMTVMELMRRVSKKKRDEEFFRRIAKIKKAHFREVEKDSKNMASPISPGFVVQAIK